MTFKKGDPRINKAGRPKGSKNTWTKLTNAQRQLLAKENDGLTPLQLLYSVMRSEDAPLYAKIDAAKAAAPYIHRKMPIAIEGGSEDRPLRFDISALRKLSTAEASHLSDLLTKMGVGTAKTAEDAHVTPASEAAAKAAIATTFRKVALPKVIEDNEAEDNATAASKSTRPRKGKS